MILACRADLPVRRREWRAEELRDIRRSEA
jgi:hypothetical protein